MESGNPFDDIEENEEIETNSSIDNENVDPIKPEISAPPSIELLQRYLSRDYTAQGSCIFIVNDHNIEGSLFTKKAYYLIQCRTMLPDYPSSKFSVKRTFGDVNWLKQQLEFQYPYCIIPPLLNAKSFTQSETNDDLITKRRRIIQRFLNRVGSHPILSSSKELFDFLSGNQKSFKQLRKAKEREKKEVIKLIDKRKSFKFFSPSSFSTQDSTVMEKMNEFQKEVKELEKSFRSLHKSALDIVNKRNITSESTKQFSKILGKFNSKNTVRYPSSKVDTKTLLDILISMQNTLELLNKIDCDYVDVESDALYEMIKDWTVYMNEACKYTERFQQWRCIYSETKIYCENLIKKLEKLNNEVKETRSKEELVNEEIENMEFDTPNSEAIEKEKKIIESVDMKEAKQLLELHQKKLQLFMNNFDQERRFFDNFRFKEMMYWTNYYANLQITIHQKIVQAWKNYISDFNEKIIYSD